VAEALSVERGDAEDSGSAVRTDDEETVSMVFSFPDVEMMMLQLLLHSGLEHNKNKWTGD